jgi:integrase
MAIYDRWHKEPADGDQACKCGKGRHKLYPSAVHGQGKRWQVRWDDPDSATRRQPRRNFDLLGPPPGEQPDRNKHASAFDKEIQGSIVRNDYADPNAGSVTLQEYAETWRGTRGHNEESAGLLAARLRNHVYQDPANPGRSPRGALSIGQHSMSLLAQRPTLAAAWVTSLKGPLAAERSRRQVVDDVSAACAAAVADGIMRRNPFDMPVVQKPGRGGPKAQPFTAAEVRAVSAELPGRLKVVPELGAGTGMRAMELAAIGVHDFQFLGKRPRVRVERQLKKIGGRFVFAPLKNKKAHDVPLAPSVARAVNRHIDAHPPLEVKFPWHEPGSKRHGELVPVRLLLTADDGGALTRAAFQGAWRVAAAKAVKAVKRDGARHLTVTGQNMHRLRHTYASAQLRKGVDVVRLAAAMGDTTDVVVRTYAHLMRDDDGDRDLRDAVDDFLSSAPGVPSEGATGESEQAGSV